MQPSTSVPVIRRVLLALLVVLIVGATFVGGRRLGMSTRVTTRHEFYSIPCAISRLYFNTRGYIILGDVADLFIAAHPNVTDETLQQSLSLDPRRDRLMFFPADDKGSADFVTLSFLMFGLNIEGLYYAWFVMFAVPIALFVAVYWHEPARLVALCMLLLGIYVGFFALPLTTELFSIHNPRSFGVVSLVSLLYLCFAMINRQRASAVHIAAAVVQATFIAFSIHVRSTEFWQVLCVLTVVALILLREHSRQGVRALWPAGVLVAAIIGLDLYQRASFDRVYQSTHIQHRIFWHNVGIGFALNPVLASEYDLSVDDTPMIELVRRRLVETNRASEVDEVFRPRGFEQYTFYGIAKDYARYERVAREVVASIVWHNKREALKTFLVDKPRVLFRQLVWATGYGGYSTDDLYLTGQASALVHEQARQEKGIYLNVLNPWVWTGLIVAVLLGGPKQTHEYVTLCGLSTLMCTLSLLPSLLAYPIISALGVSLVTVPFLLLSLFALFVQAVLARVLSVTRWPLNDRSLERHSTA